MLFRVMDQTGDTRHDFDCADPAAMNLAKAMFKKLAKGPSTHIAYAKGEGGVPNQLLREFDPAVNEVVFHPKLVAG